jgi:hypothetical protein
LLFRQRQPDTPVAARSSAQECNEPHCRNGIVWDTYVCIQDLYADVL